MRRSTFFSFLFAAVLAVVAVFGVQQWLNSERQNILQQVMQNTEKPDDATMVVVASTPLRFGERVTASKLKLIEWPGGSIPAGAFSNLENVVGKDEQSSRYVLSAIEVDEPVLNSKITIPGQKAKLSTALRAGMKAVTIRVNDVSGIAGFVLPGDRVDVLLTRGGRSGDNSTVDVLLQGVNVLAIDQLADERADKPSVVRTVTFEVSTEEAQKLILGSQIGTLSLALRNIGSADVERPERMSVKDLFGAGASESLAQEIANQDDGRLEGIEEAVKTVDQRINEVEESLRNEVEQALLQRQAEEAKPVVQAKPAVPQEPQFVKVFVTKNGRRVEYKFRAN
jgi:pilus assembly protein CpaB